MSGQGAFVKRKRAPPASTPGFANPFGPPMSWGGAGTAPAVSSSSSSSLGGPKPKISVDELRSMLDNQRHKSVWELPEAFPVAVKMGVLSADKLRV